MSLLVRSLAAVSAILVLGSRPPLFAQTAPDAMNTGSLLGDVGRDDLRFFTTGETYVVLGVGLAASASVRPLDDPITRSAFNFELCLNEDSSVDEAFEAGEALGGAFVQVDGWRAGLPAFGIASYVSASRLSENKHYLSDFVFGAAIGLTAGGTVTFARPRTRFDVAPVAARSGASVNVSVSRVR